MERRELICIGCPMGCPMIVDIDKTEIQVSGNTPPSIFTLEVTILVGLKTSFLA